MNAIFIQLILLFGYILLGFTCNKLGLFDSNSDKIFSNLLLKITLPASIIASSIGQSTENQIAAVYVLLIAAAIFIITPFWALIFQRLFRCDDTYKLMLTYPNLGFMGFPIIKALYGDLGLFFASLFMITFNLSVFSYGISAIQKGSKFHGKKLLNPGIVSALLAIVIFLFAIPVPTVLTSFLSTIGNITSPLAMITLGSTLAAISIKSVLQDKLLYIFTFCKLILWPFLVWLPLHYLVSDSMIIGITVILTSLPVAGNVSMLCISYGGNTELAAKGTFISTLLSFLSIPVYMLLFAVS
jgi:predicted permease